MLISKYKKDTFIPRDHIWQRSSGFVLFLLVSLDIPVCSQADGVFSLTFGSPYVFFTSDGSFKENWLGIKSGGVTPLQLQILNSSVRYQYHPEIVM